VRGSKGEKGRERKRKEEKGRERKRKEEKGRDRKRKERGEASCLHAVVGVL
jgi:hypothetical protein